jgi:hypothetical protein
MSSITSIYRIHKAKFNGAKISELIDHDQAVDLAEAYEWSGYVMMGLLDFLDEMEIGLGEDLDIVLDNDQRFFSFLSKADYLKVKNLELDQLLDESVFSDHVEEFDDDEKLEAATDSIDLLCKLLSENKKDEILVVAIA